MWVEELMFLNHILFQISSTASLHPQAGHNCSLSLLAGTAGLCHDFLLDPRREKRPCFYRHPYTTKEELPQKTPLYILVA